MLPRKAVGLYWSKGATWSPPGPQYPSLQICFADVVQSLSWCMEFCVPEAGVCTGFCWTSWDSWGSSKSLSSFTLNPKWTEDFIDSNKNENKSNESNFSFRWFLKVLQTFRAVLLPRCNVLVNPVNRRIENNPWCSPCEKYPQLLKVLQLRCISLVYLQALHVALAWQ